MILMELTAEEKTMYAIVKYEHDQVLRYHAKGAQVVLENVTDTFTRSPDAMQKAALIDMSEENPMVMVLDRNVRGGISGFFQGFLNVRRKKSEREMTKTLLDVVKSTSSKHLDELPRDFSKEAQARTDEFLQSRDQFDDEEFFTQVFGSHANDSIRSTYKHRLEEEDLANEQFYLDKEAAAKSTKRKIKTAEGVTIYYGEKAGSTIKVSYGQNGEKDVIIIESARIQEE